MCNRKRVVTDRWKKADNTDGQTTSESSLKVCAYNSAVMPVILGFDRVDSTSDIGAFYCSVNGFLCSGSATMEF
jgi:hypothetical protein